MKKSADKAVGLFQKVNDNAALYLGAYMTLKGTYGTIKKTVLTTKSKFRYSVTVLGDDSIYPDLHAWLMRDLSDRDKRNLTARTITRLSHGSERKMENRIGFFATEGHTSVVRLGGHRVEVAVTRDSNLPSNSVRGTNPDEFRSRDRVILSTSSVAGRETVVRFLQKLAEDRANAEQPPSFWTTGPYPGEWSARELPVRPLTTVVLREGQSERLTADLDKFLHSESLYNARAVPYHRGYLLYGPPGSGKTSLATALANHFHMNVYYLPLSDVKNDSSLMLMVSQIEPRSMLLLEDVDVFHATRARDDKEQGVTMSGLLNVLDGMGTPHGLVSVLTTNHVDALDEALTRPGRCDRSELIGPVDDYQVWGMFRMFFGFEPVGLPPVEGTVAATEVSEVLKQNMEDPDGALVGLKELLSRPHDPGLHQVAAA